MSLTLISQALQFEEEGRWSKDDGYDTEKGKKKKKTFFNLLLLLHVYDAKLEKFKFYRGHEQKTTISFTERRYGSLEFHPREIHQHWPIERCKMRAMIIKTEQIHFLGDVFAAIVFV